MPSPDSLDIEDPVSLIEYLRRSGRVDAGETPAVRMLAGGVSNKTVWIGRSNGDTWVLKQALPKLRVKADWFSDPARIMREAEGLRWLPRFAPPGTITPLVFEDRAHHVLAMQAVPAPHENWKSMLLSGRLESNHVEQFGRMLASIHRLSAEIRVEVAAAFSDRSFFESLRLEPYFAYAAEQEPRAARFLGELIQTTLPRRLTLVHGDFSPKNVLIFEGRLILLDHEVIHFGDPAFDLGFAMTHLLSKANHLPACRERFLAATHAFWKTYLLDIGSAPWAEDLETHAINSTLGCLLGRVAGRSLLEYLDADARRRQREAVVRLMQSPPQTMRMLIEYFAKEIESCPPSKP